MTAHRVLRVRLLSQVSAVALAITGVLAAGPSLAQSAPNVIVPDGRTATTVVDTGPVTEVTTRSVVGTNAFNSFSQFTVGHGGTVNLQLPDGASTLFNVVRAGPITIDGILNSYRQGTIGGHVYFASPYGLVVGAQGVMNVGALTVSTPTSEFLEQFISPTGAIDAGRMADLAAGAVPVSKSGSIVISGVVNTGSVGTSAASAAADGAGDGRLFSRAVNAQGLTQAALSDAAPVAGGRAGGDIRLAAGGDVAIDGKLSTASATGDRAGAIHITADGDIHVGGAAQLDSHGEAAASGGEIYLMAQGDTHVAQGARFDSGARGSGDAANMEVSAKRQVNLAGATFDAGAAQGKAGRILFDPVDVTISNINTSNGGDLKFDASNSLTVSATGQIDTRAQGTVSAAVTAAGKSGDITITAPNITIAKGAILNASATSGFNAGNITLSATDTDTQAFGKSTASTSITIAGQLSATTLANDDPGGKITITAVSSATSSYSDGGIAGFLTTLDTILGITGLNGGYVAADATSVITVQDGASIDGGAVTLSATNTASVDDKIVGLLSPLGVGVGVVVGSLNSTATVDVQAGAQIHARGSLDISATNNATLDISAYSISVGKALLDGTLAYSTATVAASATVNRGASIEVDQTLSNTPVAGALSITATNTNSFETSATSDAYGLGTAGIALAIADGITTTATASNGANTTVDGGSVLVAAQSNTTNNVVDASTTVGNGVIQTMVAGGPKGASFQSAMANLPNLGNLVGSSADGSPKLGSAIGLALDQTHTATATIDSGASEAASIQAQQVAVVANVVDQGIRNQGTSTVNSNATTTGTSTASNSLSAGITYGDYTHTADASIGSATVKAPYVGVLAKTDLPVTDTLGAKLHGGAADVFSEITSYLNLTGGLSNDLFTSFANATGSATNLGLAGSVNYFSAINNARAWVAPTASIQSALGSLPAAWSATHGSSTFNFAAPVTVQAYGSLDSIIVAGNYGPTGSKTTGGDSTAVGAAVNYAAYTSNVTAGIDSGAVVNTDGALLVDAETYNSIFAFAPAAGILVGGLAFDGSLSLTDINVTNHASISKAATVTAKSVEVDATTGFNLWSIGGDITVSKGSGVGLTGAVALVTSDTQAYVGDNSGDRPDDVSAPTSASTGSVQTDGLTVQAVTEGRIGTAAVAAVGAFTSDPNAPASPPSALGNAVAAVSAFGSKVSNFLGLENNSAPAQPPGQPEYNIGVSGAAAVTLPKLSTQAFLDGAQVSKLSGPLAVDVAALNNTFIDSGAGAAALAMAKNPNAAASAAVGGVVAAQLSKNTTTATIKGSSTLTGVHSLDVHAVTGARQTSVGLAGAVNASSTGSTKVTVTGSVSLIEIDDSTNASIQGGTVTGDGATDSSVNVASYDSAKIGAGGGSLSIGGTQGLGAAVTYASIQDGTGDASGASVVGATLSSFGSVAVSAGDATKVAAGGAMVAVSGDGSSLDGALVILDSDKTATARLEDATLSSIGAGGVSVTAAGADNPAYDSILTAAYGTSTPDSSSPIDFTSTATGVDLGTGTSIIGVAGAIDVGASNVGLSWVSSRIRDTRNASVEESTITTTGDLDVTASTDTANLLIAVGLSGANSGLTGLGSVVLADIGATTTATVQGEQLVAGDYSLANLSVTATDSSTVKSAAGNVSIGDRGASAGDAAVAVNLGSGTTSALLDFAVVRATGDLTISATTSSDLEALAVAGAGTATQSAVDFAGAATTNKTSNTTTAGLTSTTTLGTPQDVAVTATDTTTFKSLAGGLAAGESSVALGVGIGVNKIGNTVTAKIDQAVIGAQNVTVGASFTPTIKSLGVGAALSSSFRAVAGAGSVAVNLVSTDTTAEITGAGSQITAQNNVGVTASEDDEIEVIAGSLGAGLSTPGIGLSAVVNEMSGTTKATIDSANVTALALGATSLTVPTGQLATAIDTAKISAPSDSAPDLTQTTKTVQGVAVNAASSQSLTGISFSAGASAVQVAGSAVALVNIMGGSTLASINDATINSATGAAAGQQVDVTAGSNLYAGGFVLGAAASGGNAGSAAVAVNKFDQTTKATITDSRTSAASGVSLAAAGTQNVAAIAVGLGAASGLGGAGTGILNLFSGDTEAYLTGGGVSSGGLAISATSDAQANSLGGGLGLSGSGALGATFTVNLSDMTTLAYAGSSSDATEVRVNTGDIDVSATTTSDFHDLGISGALSGNISIAGMVDVAKLSNTTRAGLYSLQNFAGTGDVTVTATEKSTLDQTLGGGAGGAVAGVGAAVVVDIVQSSVTAELVNTTITTTGDVTATATSNKDVTTVAATGSIGETAGIDAGVSVVLVGSGESGKAGSETGGVIGQVSSFTSSGSLTVFSDTSIVDQDATNSATSAQPSGVESASPDLTVASISGGRTTAKSVTVGATNTTSVKSTTGAGAAGIVGVGVGVGYARVYSNVTAQIGGGARISAANVTVTATAQDGSDGVEVDSYIGSAGGLALTAAVADAKSDNTVEASVQGEVDGGMGGSGALTISATDTSSATTNTFDVDVGAGAAAGSVSYATKTSSVTGTLASGGASGFGTVTITGSGSGAVTAHAVGASGGLLSGAGADAKATDGATVTASLGGAVTSGDVTLSATYTPDASAQALGADGALGVAVGVALAEADLTSSVSAAVADNARLGSAKSLTVAASLDAGDTTSKSKAVAGTGGLLLGVNAAKSTATYSGTVTAGIGEDVALPDGDVSVTATSTTSQQADSTGIVAGVLAAGANFSTVTVTGNTTASLGSGATTSATRAGDLTVQATSSDKDRANATAGSGGIAAGAAAVSTTSNTSTTTAQVMGASGDAAVHAQDIVVGAAHTTDYFGTSDSTQAAAVGYSGSTVNNTIVSNVNSTVGQNASLVGRNIAATATSTATDQAGTGSSAKGGAGGVLNGDAVSSTTTITETPVVTVGANTSLTATGDANGAGLIFLEASNNVVADDTVTLNTGGVIQAPSGKSSVTATSSNGVTIGDGASLNSTTGRVQIGTVSNASAAANAAVKTYGLATSASGKSVAQLNGAQTITIGDADIKAHGDIVITTGRAGDGSTSNDLTATASTDVYNDSALAAPGPDTASGAITNSNKLTVATGATITSASDVTLGTVVGERFASGKATSHTPLTGATSLVNYSGTTNVTDTAASVLNGHVTAGAEHSKSLTIAADGTVTTSTSGSDPVSYTTLQNFVPSNEVNALIAQLRAGPQSDQVAAAIAVLSRIPASTTPGTAVQVGDLFASGGSITLEGLTFSADPGSGASLTANGGASISINNASSDHLVLGDLTIPNTPDAGQVNVAGAGAAGAIANLTINRNNAGVAPTISVNTTYDGQSPTAEIFSLGGAQNLGGSVAFLNNSGSIALFDSVKAASVSIQAPNGFASYTALGQLITTGPWPSSTCPGGVCFESVTHRTDDPDTAVRLVANVAYQADTTSNELEDYLTMQPEVTGTQVGTAGHLTLFLSLGNVPDDSSQGSYHFREAFYTDPIPRDSTSWSQGSPWTQPTAGSAINGQASAIQGDQIAIIADTIDVNGAITAGGAHNASVHITAQHFAPEEFGTAASAAYAARQAYLRTGRYQAPVQLDASVVNLGDLALSATYDPVANLITVDNASVAHAGSVYLNGKIISTNPFGSITVQSGASNISVVNDTPIPIRIRDIDSGSGVSGQIQIVDQLKMTNGVPLTTWFVYRPGGGIFQYQSTTGASSFEQASLVAQAQSRSSSYAPAANTRLQLTENANLSRSFTLNPSSYASPDTTVTAWTFDTPPYTGGASSNYTFDWAVTNESGQADYVQTVTGSVTDYQTVFVDWHQHWGFTGPTWFQHDVVTGVNINFVTSVKADHPIAINFAGSDAGSVNVTSVGAVNLTGQISNAGGATNITTTAGAIAQTAAAGITSSSLGLSAVSGIGTAAQPIAVNLSGGLTAATRSGPINISSPLGGLTVIQAWSGKDLATGALLGAPGPVSISAAGNLFTSNTNVINTWGSSVTLNSTGAPSAGYQIGLSAGGGPISASAGGDISIWSNDAQMQIGQIVSQNGDVTVTALAGDIVSAPSRSQVDTQVEQSLADALDLTVDTGAAAVSAYNSNVQRQYADYWRIRQYNAGGADAFNITGNEAPFSAQVAEILGVASPTNAQIVSTIQGIYNAARTYLSQVPGLTLGSAYNPSFTYQLSTSSPLYAQLTHGAAWSAAQLSAAVSSDALLPVSDTQYITQTPNISGRNVTLTASQGSIGSNAPPLVFSVASNASSITTDQAAALAAAEPGDVTQTPTTGGTQYTVAQQRFVGVSASGSFTATAQGDVLVSTPGTLDLGLGNGGVQSNTGEVRLRAGQDILDGFVAAKIAYLEAATGNIGSSSAPIDLFAPDGTSRVSLTSARAKGDINIATENGGLYLGDLFAGGDLRVTAFGPVDSLFNQGADHIQANNFTITASNQDVGKQQALTVNLSGTLSGAAKSLNLASGEALTVGSLTIGGDVNLAAKDLVLNGVVSADTVEFLAANSIAVGPNNFLSATTSAELKSDGASQNSPAGTVLAGIGISAVTPGTMGVLNLQTPLLTAIASGSGGRIAIDAFGDLTIASIGSKASTIVKTNGALTVQQAFGSGSFLFDATGAISLPANLPAADGVKIVPLPIPSNRPTTVSVQTLPSLLPSGPEPPVNLPPNNPIPGGDPLDDGGNFPDPGPIF